MLQLLTYITTYLDYGTTPVNNSFRLTGHCVNMSHSSSSAEEGVAVEQVGERVTDAALSAQTKPTMGKSQ